MRPAAVFIRVKDQDMTAGLDDGNPLVEAFNRSCPGYSAEILGHEVWLRGEDERPDLRGQLPTWWTNWCSEWESVTNGDRTLADFDRAHPKRPAGVIQLT